MFQGELGDCWLLAAMSSLAMDHNILHKVIPAGQGFSKNEDYTGMFRYRLVLLILNSFVENLFCSGYGNMVNG